MPIQTNYPDRKVDYLLSIVITGRNDNYLGDFKYRITTCINFLARSAEKINRLSDIELVVVDWNSEVPLYEVLSLSKEAEEITKFIIVPPDIASQYNKNGLPFHPMCSVNTGIRRSRGRYIMLIPADVLVTPIALNNLLILLEEKIVTVFDVKKTMLNVGRKWIPWQIVERKPGMDEWDRYLQMHCSNLWYQSALPGLASGMGALIISRELWYGSQAFIEKFDGWGWSDIELDLRINQRYPSIVLTYFGIVFYDMEQRPKERKMYKYHYNPHEVSYYFEARNPNWGLKNHTLEIKKSAYKNDEKDNLLTNIGKTDNKGKTSGDLIAELTGHTVREHVLTTAQRCNFETTEWEILCALSWYSLYRCPRTFLEFGIKRTYCAVIVSAACPSVEIYAIDPCQVSDKSNPDLQPFNMSKMVNLSVFRGYMRLITGEISTAFQRLKSSSIGKLSFDLALVHGDMVGVDTTQQLNDIIPYLAPEGMLVFTEDSAASFQHVWDYLHGRYPQFTYLKCKNRNTGLILSASLQDNDSDLLQVGENGFQVDFGEPPKLPHGLMRLFYRVCRALRTPIKYLEYSKRILERSFRICRQ